MKTVFRWFICSLFVFMMAAMPSAASATDATAVNSLMRQAERLYFSGKAQEADALLKQAEADAAAILAGSDAAQITKVQRLEAKMKKLRADIDRKLGGAPPMSPAAPASTAPAAAGGELPSYVVSRIQGINLSLDNAQEWLDKGDARIAQSSLDVAKGQKEKTEKSYAKYLGTDHPDMSAIEKRISELEAGIAKIKDAEAAEKARTAQAAADAEAASALWAPKLKPYITPKGAQGHDPERYFTGYTEDPQEMARQNAIYARMQADMAEYRSTGPGEAATDELKQIVKNVEYQISSFQTSYADMGNLYLNESGEKIRHLLSRIQEEGKKLDAGGSPNFMSAFAFQDARASLDKAVRLIGADDARVAKLEADYAEALAGNQKLIRARIADTRMIPDKFGGSEKGDIKKTAESALKQKYPDATILRTTVITPDWQEENVVEWTDTTKTALRHRVTHSVSAQIAGKRGGDVKLYTLHVAKDRRSDGGWGALHGHVMFEDPMLEENVSK